MFRSARFAFLLLLGALLSVPNAALADEGGVSFWVPGFFGSLAAFEADHRAEGWNTWLTFSISPAPPRTSHMK